MSVVAVSLDAYVWCNLLLALEPWAFDSQLPQLENDGENPHAVVKVLCNHVCKGALNVINYLSDVSCY